jgi:hypothetical protein
MQLTMMHAAERHGELVADLQAKASRLCKAQMMSIGGLITANQTGLAATKARCRLSRRRRVLGVTA